MSSLPSPFPNRSLEALALDTQALSCEEARFKACTLRRAETLRSARLSRFPTRFAANYTIHVAFGALPSST